MDGEKIIYILAASIMFVVVVFFVPRQAEKERTFNKQHLYEVTIDGNVYILDKEKNKLTHSRYWGNDRISFFLDDGTYVTSQVYKIRVIPKKIKSSEEGD